MIPIEKLSGRLGNQMFRHAYLYAQVLDGVIPDVYVQDPKYFEKYSDKIKQLFGEGIGYLPFVGIHVRRGDYVGSDFHTDLSKTDYYERATALFPDENFLIFSDDTRWCRDHFIGKQYEIFEGEDEIEDFNMLASCKSQIIANSSYSWWAAYLNPNHGKRVIAPKEENWFLDGIIRTKLPASWEQI